MHLAVDARASSPPITVSGDAQTLYLLATIRRNLGLAQTHCAIAATSYYPTTPVLNLVPIPILYCISYNWSYPCSSRIAFDYGFLIIVLDMHRPLGQHPATWTHASPSKTTFEYTTLQVLSLSAHSHCRNKSAFAITIPSFTPGLRIADNALQCVKPSSLT